MSLVGNLEDLGLVEILQIVSLSSKSGVLKLESGGRWGNIVFRDGQVVRASSSAYPENLGDLLLRGGVVDIERLKRALLVQQQSPKKRRIGDILANDFDVDRDAIESAVRQQVERIVYSFFSWKDGAFSFELGGTEILEACSLDPLQFMLDNGLNPQWLAREGSRILDERRHRGEVFDEQGESTVNVEQLLSDLSVEDTPRPATDSPAFRPDSVPDKKVLLIDDDLATAERLAALFNERKVHVRAFTNSMGFMQAVAESDPLQTILLVDLIMPRRDGSGLLGGLELLEELREKYPDFNVMVMSDNPNKEAEQSVFKYGVSALLTKPKKTEVQQGSGQAALAELVDQLLSSSSSQLETSATNDAGLFNIGEELMREIGESNADFIIERRQPSPGLHLLRGMLEELNNPALGGSVILLTLRFASELMNRAVILLVKEQDIVGLGQFGIELQGESADDRVRNTRIPLDQKNLFSHALHTHMSSKFKPEDNAMNRYLFDQLGGQTPAEVFVGPLVSEGRVVAVLYGDSLPDDTPIGDTEALEIFLSQAGLAMHKALLN
ncbi:MAG: response regulator [Deltaproteobacteria bacterium]|jgi:CheY-like chemotaxis protein|nr:response regulator [Deltaproteobacteria bacterium]